MRVTAVVGGQYGSEGKGVIVGHICKIEGADVCVRVGGPNAGHTVVGPNGKTYKMRSVPCGFVNPDCLLVLGPAAVVDLDVLLPEIDLLEADGFDIWSRLKIDTRALVIQEHNRRWERQFLKESIGSVATGVGSARAAHMLRQRDGVRRIKDVDGFDSETWSKSVVPDVTRLYQGHVVLEGTQGFGLSLNFGPWPYVTSRDCTVAQLANDCGIPPFGLNRIVMVVRTFPIRVGGNSGPMLGETTWEAVSKMAGRKVEEFTTVSKTMRRVALWDEDLYRDALRINDATDVAMMFADYMHPQNWAVESRFDLEPSTRVWLDSYNPTWIGTGRKDTSHDFTVIN